jgi:hypothetical protein
MTQAELNRAVARTTGESVFTIKQLGFLLDGDRAAAKDRCLGDPGPHVVDWDELDAQRSETAGEEDCRELARH